MALSRYLVVHAQDRMQERCQRLSPEAVRRHGRLLFVHCYADVALPVRAVLSPAIDEDAWEKGLERIVDTAPTLIVHALRIEARRDGVRVTDDEVFHPHSVRIQGYGLRRQN